VIGAGAIGGLVGGRLAAAGCDVTLMVRGANLEAIRRQGICLLAKDGSDTTVRAVKASNDYAAVGVQDVVMLAVKAHQLANVAADAARLVGPQTVVVTLQNGIPYWYFHRHGGALAGTVVHSVDPFGTLARHLPPDQVLGCVVYPASELVAPGVVAHIEGDRLPLGELDGSCSERATRISECFVGAGFKAPILDDIRAEIWLKLWGNLTFNPISALTRATLVDICEDDATRALAAEMMSEAQAVGEKLGIAFRVSLERRIAGAAKVGKHKTSMLQDIEAGREPELEALVGSVMELGRLTGVATPHIDAVYGLAHLLAQTLAAQRQEAAPVRVAA
jgi:2-dehydropantoate 2-reductase